MITFLIVVPLLANLLLFLGGVGNAQKNKDLDARVCALLGLFSALILSAALFAIKQTSTGP